MGHVWRSENNLHSHSPCGSWRLTQAVSLGIKCLSPLSPSYWPLLISFLTQRPETSSNSFYRLLHSTLPNSQKSMSKVFDVVLVWLMGFMTLEIKCQALHTLDKGSPTEPHPALRFLTKYHLIRQTCPV